MGSCVCVSVCGVWDGVGSGGVGWGSEERWGGG